MSCGSRWAGPGLCAGPGLGRQPPGPGRRGPDFTGWQLTGRGLSSLSLRGPDSESDRGSGEAALPLAPEAQARAARAAALTEPVTQSR
jgi:hypothetical protein